MLATINQFKQSPVILMKIFYHKLRSYLVNSKENHSVGCKTINEQYHIHLHVLS